MALNVNTSIVDYLKSQGRNSSFSSRAQLAKQHGIAGYRGTASQNKQLMNILKNAAAPKPTPAAPQPTTPKPAAPKPPPLSTAPIPEFNPLPSSAQSININELLQRAQDLMAPLTQIQKDTTQSTFNQQMQRLNDQFASRGLLASGVAASQQAQATQGLAGQMAAIDAEAQARALDQALQQGQFLEGQRQFDLGFALDEGALTGNYLPSGSRDLINELVQQRRIIENANTTSKEKQDAQNKANFITQQLQTMGLNTAGFSGDTDLATMLRSLQSGVGQRTLPQQQQDLDVELGRSRQRLDEQRLGLDEQRLGLDRDKFDFDREVGRWEMAFRQRQQEIDRNLAQQGINIDRSQLELSRMNAQTEREYKQHLIDMGVTEEEARRRTNATIADVMAMNSADEVYEYLMKNANEIGRDGIDVRSVLDAVERRFPNEGFDSLLGELK